MPAPDPRRRARRGPPASPARQRGVALILVFVLTLLGLGASIYAANSARTELRIAVNDALSKQARAVALAGIYHAKALIGTHLNLNDELAANSSGACTANGVGNASSGIAGIGAAKSLGGNCWRFRSFGITAADGYYVRVEDNHDETSGSDNPLQDIDHRIHIISTGTVATATRTISVVVTLPINWGLVSGSTITLSGGATVDSFSGSYSGSNISSNANVAANGNISLSGGSTAVNGNATSTGTVTTAGGSTVSGTITNGAATVALPAVAACSPYSSGTGISPLSTYNPATGALNGSSGVTVTLSPGSYCFSSVILSGNSTLAVSGPTVINVSGNMDLSGGSVVNNTYSAANLAFNVAGTTVNLSGGSAAYFTITAPAAAVTLSGGAGVYGQIIGQSINDSGGGAIHEDLGLAGKATLGSWHEVRS